MYEFYLYIKLKKREILDSFCNEDMAYLLLETYFRNESLEKELIERSGVTTIWRQKGLLWTDSLPPFHALTTWLINQVL